MLKFLKDLVSNHQENTNKSLQEDYRAIICRNCREKSNATKLTKKIGPGKTISSKEDELGMKELPSF